MAKVKYNVSGVEGGGDFTPPKPGVYVAKIAEASRRTGEKNDIEVVYEIVKGDFKGSRIWDYVPLTEAAAFRLRQFIDALGLGEKGTLDTDKILGKKVKIRVKGRTWNDEYRAEIGSVFALDDDTEDDSDDGDDDDDDDLDDEEQGDGDGDEEQDFSEMDNAELKAAVEENDGDLSEITDGVKGVSKKRAAIIAWLEENASGDDDDDEASDDDEDGDDYDEWETKELKEELKTRGLKTGGNKAALIKRLREDDEDEEDPF